MNQELHLADVYIIFQVDVNNQNKSAKSSESYQRFGGHVVWPGGTGWQLTGGKSKLFLAFCHLQIKVFYSFCGFYIGLFGKKNV